MIDSLQFDREREATVSKSTISTFQLFELIPDEKAAITYLEGRLWPSGARCPKCRNLERVSLRKDGMYMCNFCVLKFSIRTGTIFERSHVPLHKWVYAMYLLVTARKGISSMRSIPKLKAPHNPLSYDPLVGEASVAAGGGGVEQFLLLNPI